MKLIFLDIDGCLNAHEWDAEVMCGQIHADKVALLNRILRATGACIVLSSAWRYIVHRGEANLHGMEWLLRSHGVLADSLVGVTRPDSMERLPYDGNPASLPVANERGQQIADWLEEHGHTGSYVVIDDIDLGITAAGHPLVLCDGATGLTAREADEAIRILEGQLC